MRTAIMTVFLCCGINSSGFAQAPDTSWMRLFGGPGNDYGYWLDKTDDGGYIAAGSYFQDIGNTDFYLVKTDQNGVMIWDSIFGYDYYDVCRWIYQTADGGYFGAGTQGLYGNTDENFFIFKTDSLGGPLWSYSYGGSQEDVLISAKPTSDGGYILIGNTASFGSGYMDVWLVKIDSCGEVIWTRTFGGSYQDFGAAAMEMSDGGFLILCNIIYDYDDMGMTLIKTDADGYSQWTKRYCQNFATGVSFVPTIDGGYLILANTLAFHDDYDIQLLKIEEDGDSLWTQIIGGNDIYMGESIQDDNGNGFVICGLTGTYWDNDIFLVKVDAAGSTCWTRTFAGYDYNNDLGSCAKPTNDGGIILTGSMAINDFDHQLCLIRMAPEITVLNDTPGNPRLPELRLKGNYPNPFNMSTMINFEVTERSIIKLAVYDILGRRVTTLLDEIKQPGSYNVKFDGAGLSSGAYFYRLQAGEASESGRMELLK